MPRIHPLHPGRPRSAHSAIQARRKIMNARFSVLTLGLVALFTAAATLQDAPKGAAANATAAKAAPEWDFNATIIEACSCPMFCQCYFNARPAGPGWR